MVLMDWSEVQKLVAQGEGLRVEFKETAYLSSDSKEIGYDLISFANRRGGYILVGIRNDRSKEGKKIDADKAQLRILEIANNNCSPPVELSFDFSSKVDGDVLIIHVHRKKDMPHAVVERSSAEISKRVYYIRKGSGKRLVDDYTLRFLFKEREFPDLSLSTRIAFWYEKHGNRLVFTQYFPHLMHFRPFMERLEAVGKKLDGERESKIVMSVLAATFPYALLYRFSLLFSSSWIVELTRTEDEDYESAPSRFDLPSVKCKPENIPIKGIEVFKKFDVDIKKLTKKHISPFMLPEGTSVVVEWDNDESALSFINSHFNIRISASMNSWGVGYPYPSDDTDFESDLKSGRAHAMFDLRFEAEFDLLDVPDPLFEEHYTFAKIIEDIVSNEWNWALEVKKIKEQRIGTVIEKLDEVLDILKGEEDFERRD